MPYAIQHNSGRAAEATHWLRTNPHRLYLGLIGLKLRRPKDTTFELACYLMAMAAARLGMPEKAVDALFMDVQKNTYLKNGHNHQDERLRLYRPGNGGLLTAVAMMVAGWEQGPERDTLGFPNNGKWKIWWEGLHKMQ